MIAQPTISSTYLVFTDDHKQFVGRFRGTTEKYLWEFEVGDKARTVKPECTKVEEIKIRPRPIHPNNFGERQFKLLFSIEDAQVTTGVGRLSYKADEKIAYDLVQAGFVTQSYGVFTVTEKGWIISALLRKWLSKGQGSEGFKPQV